LLTNAATQGAVRPAVAGVALCVLVAVAPALAACRGHASPEECRAMTEHYLDLAVAESPGAATMNAPQKQAVRDVERGLKRAEPSFRRVEDACTQVTRSEASCALDAPTTRAWETCLHPPDAGGQ
jgi:hypothetical protein